MALFYCAKIISFSDYIYSFSTYYVRFDSIRILQENKGVRILFEKGLLYSRHAIIVILPLHSAAPDLFLQNLCLSYETSGMYNIKYPSQSHCQWTNNTSFCYMHSQLTNSWTSHFHAKLHQILPMAIMDLFIHFCWSLSLWLIPLLIILFWSENI
jgi:hypothetical protein